jgi:hypothetical protein
MALYEAKNLFEIPIHRGSSVQEIAYTWYQGYSAAVSLTVIQKYSCKANVSSMYVCEGWAIKTSPCTATFNDLLCYPYSLTLY